MQEDFDILRKRLQKVLSDTAADLSARCMELAAQKTVECDPEVKRRIEALVQAVLEHNRGLAADTGNLLHSLDQLQRRLAALEEEKRRLEVLYASGISFSTVMEMRALMEMAIDTVLRELKADAGFIVLADSAGGVQSITTRNIDPEGNPEAFQMSTTVIRDTMARTLPLEPLDPAQDAVLARQQSIVRLGISAVLCVPLVSGDSVLGAVYLDRRRKERPFTDADLTFLLSFARQIVRGMRVSLEISTLEKKVRLEDIQNIAELRRTFECSEIAGTGRKLFEVLKLAAKVAPTDASVVILGENGTGKDLLAQAIHRNSPRNGKPFVTINCGAIPDDLLESELFGYESGAFTGANKSKPGKIELADGGTLFFDEIGEMNVNLQAKLLRVIQTREIERVGGVQSKKISVRILAATNRNIASMIEEGTFREDLYYRLKVFEITMPPLRERKEDIAQLASMLLHKHAPAGEERELRLEALEVLERYSWPGNVRELENVLQRALVLAQGPEIGVEELPPELMERGEDTPSVAAGKSLEEAETEFRRMYIIRTMRNARTKAEAAQMLGVNRTHFYRLLAQLGIDSEI